jgi:hypothetical protein
MDNEENSVLGCVSTIDNEKESPLQGTRLNSKFGSQTLHEENLVLNGVRIAATGSFPHLEEGDHSILGPAHDLYIGKNFLKQLIVSHGDKYSNTITTSTSFPLIGHCPVRAKVEKAVSKGVCLVRYAMFQRIIYGKLTLAEALAKPEPETTEDSQDLGPPSIQRDAEMPDPEEKTAGKIKWSNLELKKRKDPSATPDQSTPVDSLEIVCPRGVLDLACLQKRKVPEHIRIVHVTLQVLSGIVKDLVMDLTFMGLDTLWAEDKSVCFIHPKDSEDSFPGNAKTCQKNSRKFMRTGLSSIKIS